ncbi:hypothetical protein PHYC_03231 [Phycisphaerales bacterium]|nr:hypothetical protein PHYC_03231 [Phycisphaerales bacterium]
MADGRFSAWDRFSLPYTTFNEAFVSPPNTVEAMRCRGRTEVIERYIKLLALGIDEDRRGIELQNLAKEIGWRRHHWAKPGVRLSELRAEFSPRRTRPLRIVIAGAAILTGFVAYAQGLSAAWLASAGVGVLLLLLILYFHRGRQSAADVLARRICPDCGYRLFDLRCEINLDEIHGLWIGPRACPECGSPWPMVPPPVFDS